MRWEWNRPISYLYASETQERRLKGVKIQKLSRGSMPSDPLETCAFGAGLGNRSVDPRSAPVRNLIVEVSLLLCNDWGYSTLGFSRILVKMQR